MRYANLVFFLIAAALGITLSVAAMWKLPFGLFTISEDGFRSVIDLLNAGSFSADKFYATEALKEVAIWGEMFNFIFAAVCATLAVLPAFATIRIAEGKLFERRVDRGWKMIVWMAGLGALVVAIHPAPMFILIYILICSMLISGYIVTYQWPKKPTKRDPLQIPELKEARQWSHRRIAGETSQHP